MSMKVTISTYVDAEQHWAPSECDSVKVNCDAAFDNATRNSLGAAIAHDFSRAIIEGNVVTFHASSVSAIEAYTLRLGQLLTLQEGYDKAFDCSS
ncbi:hypothetical protein V6N12_037752 [Hibiscus sabdariffa]|uniref:Uncharacterized protein n=1 Tax=Hibiscus sabdariffa TaxID=183260 RepID=A0ABR2C3G4_9ROSI